MTFMEQVETFLVNLWASLGTTVTSALMKLVWALLVLVIGLKVAKWIVKKVDKSKRMQKVEPTVHMFTITALSIALKVVVIISVITILGVPTATLTAGVAAAGAAIALGLQGGLSNVAGGITILLVEQNAKQALSIAHRGYVLETGRIVLSGNAAELLENDAVKKAYLGG